MSSKTKKTISERTDLMAEWDYSANDGLNPSVLGANSHLKAWWKCKKCGRSWQADIANRSRLGRGCPYCSHQKVAIGESDLATLCPDLINEWDKEKNDCDPSLVNAGSHKKAWWKCAKGHSWSAVIKSRANGVGCPICANKVIVPGVNDLLTTHPDQAKMWHPTKNGDLKPDMVSHGSHKKVWWKDEYGNDFYSSINDVTSPVKKRVGPPTLRTSFEEQAVFYYVKKRFPDAINGYKKMFRHGMELDIYVPSIKFGIEYDGQAWHQDGGLEREKRKYDICKANGISLIRIKENRKHWKDSLGICDYIVKTVPRKDYFHLERAIRICLNIMGDIDFGSFFAVSNNLNAQNPLFTSKNETSFLGSLQAQSNFLRGVNGPNVSVDIDIKRDKRDIQKYLRSRNKSLGSAFPEIAKEWAFDLNDPVNPNMVHEGSNEKYWWRCQKCGHIWKTSVSERTGKDKTGCPKCARALWGAKRSNSVLRQKGSFGDNYPGLLEEWDYKKNIGLDPFQLVQTSNKKVWWICKKCGNSWQNTIGHRSAGQGCPFCQNKSIKTGFNDLATLFPELVLDWDFDKNPGLSPYTIAPKSGKKVAWVCHKCGYVWETKVASRTHMHSGCPNCWRTKNKKK